MSDRPKPPQKTSPSSEVPVAQQHLKALQRAIAAQNELISSAYATQRAARGQLMLKSILLEIVQVFSRLTAAEEGSVFLLNDEGVVVESILARGATMRELKRNLIGQVLDQGLAGWVVKHRRLGIIDDTEADDRWVTLAYQPYQVRSCLCIPMFRAKQICAVVTLMHQDVAHFSHLAILRYVDIVASVGGLVLDNVQQQIELAQNKDLESLNAGESLPISDPTSDSSTPTSSHSQGELTQTGVYIIAEQGKFLYANPRFAHLLDYRLEDLVTLESIFELVIPGTGDRLLQDIQRCLNREIRSFRGSCEGRGKHGDRIPLLLDGNLTRFYAKPAIVGTLSRQ
ncbi:GAF domain-containing protein [Geitlerinema sp. P-1104]|uniref:GAF domain-containing protein n=1 Tax=Geitlerinema sp. P-1104 TaxID=2546230 RepID=UPI00147754C4|nr:GAF domain-containing protein [Geitlerinema sp. P-1104]NMG57947.1 GAF domain-containing protein [Geitlerinema sp. P-1104]